MSHNEVYRWFCVYFPNYSGENAEMWFPNGRNSIRVRLKTKQDLIFTYNNKKDWRFETVNSFLNVK